MRRADSTPTAVEDSGGEAALAGVPARYTARTEIGRGGMGTVLRAHDTTLDRPVALKVLRALGAQHIARLLGEAKAMARLSHPNVVHVYDVVTSGDGAVIVMELVPGETLRRWLDAGGRSVAAVLEKFAGAGAGLRAAHQAGLVHLDFKPSNVLIGHDGVAKVTDFGLARTTDFATRESSELGLGEDRAPDGLEGGVASWGLLMTQHGVIAGTPRYMSPEQHRGERCGHATDLYAFCVALWEALVGAPPFAEDDRDGLLDAKLEGPPRWAGPNVSSALVALLRKGLQPDAADRPNTLDPILEELGRAAAPRRAWARLSLGATGAIALAGAGVWLATAGGTMGGGGPELEGFGTQSAFGEAGETCTVTRLDDDGPGTLRECLRRHSSGEEATRVVFEVGGTIELQSRLVVDDPYLTIDALTAPEPGITLSSSGRDGLVLRDDANQGTCAHDVLVQGIRFLGTWDGTAHDPGSSSTIELNAREVADCMRNIVLNRVTVIAAPDAAGDMIGSVADVTVQYSAFLRSHHPMELTNRPGEHWLHSRISLHHNVFAYFHERAPQVRGSTEDLDLVQNVIMNWNAYDFGGGYAMRFRCRDDRCPQRVNMLGNRWLEGSGDPGYALVFGTHPEQDPDDGPIASHMFMQGNDLPAANANFGLAPKRFPREEEITMLPAKSLAAEMLPWVGAPHRTDIEASILDEVASRLEN